jgi:hypothetical protein
VFPSPHRSRFNHGDGNTAKLNDSEASNEVLCIYNDWLRDFCSHYYPDHQIGLAWPPYGSVDRAAEEVRRQDGHQGP